jgi:DNA-binding NarL/FixJ family response regulator
MRILLVDASTVFLDMMEAALAPHSEAVLTATSLGQARHLIDSDRLSVVVTDADLPDGSAFELFEHLATTPEPRPGVLVLARHANARDEKRYAELGALGYLGKPTSYRDIARVVSRSQRSDWNASRRVRRRSLGKAYVADATLPQGEPRRDLFQLVWDIRDISASGAFLETKGPLEVGTELDLALLFFKSALARVKARVVRVQKPTWTHVGGVGVVFIRFAPGSEELLERYIAEAEGELY